MYQKQDLKITQSVDWFTIAIYLVLVFCGWVSIYAASYQFEVETSMFDLSTRAGSQLIWIGTSLILGFILLKLETNFYDALAYYIYIAFMLLLLLTIFIAPEIKGSRSWIVITDSIRLQPAEFAKFAVALALSKYLSTYSLKLLEIKTLAVITGIVSLPILLILMQQETGSALVYISFVLVLYRVGLPGIVLVLGATAILLFVVGLKYSEIELGFLTEGEILSIIIIVLLSAVMLASYQKDNKATRNIILATVLLIGGPYFVEYYDFANVDWSIFAVVLLGLVIAYLVYLGFKKWAKVYFLVAVFAVCSIGYVSSINYLFHEVLQPHQQMRIKVTLGMEQDLMGAGYNVNQSKIAIGSGGLHGKGFLNGTQTKLKYVPEQDTDFIFCTVGEEQGFAGSVAILILFATFILRLFYLAERQQTVFGMVYGYCVASIFLFHLAINIGMVIDITPVIGIPLPFFSYGGSSLWGFSILLFIFLRIDMSRKNR